MMSKTEFVKMVEQSFERILRQYGFTVADGTDASAILVTDRIFVSVIYDKARAFEVLVNLGRFSDATTSKVPFNLGEVFREFAVPNSSQRSYLQSASISRVAEFLESVSIALAEHCDQILRGEEDAFNRVEIRRTIEAREYTLRVQLEGIRKDADLAWQQKNYNAYASLLSGLEPVLTDGDKKKLAFAANHDLGHVVPEPKDLRSQSG